MDSAHAILLRKTRFSETSLIVTWFSEEFGKIKTMAKGALRPKGTFSGLLDLFFECEIQFARSHRSEIHTLREVSLQETREQLRRDYPRVALGAYFLELMELSTESDHPAPELFDLLSRALSHLDEKPATRRSMDFFESELVRLLGIQRPGAHPLSALLQVCHRLPPNRPALLKLLGE